MKNETEALMRRKIEETVFAGLPACEGALSPVREMLLYSLESGGKRVRPYLCLKFCEASGGNWENALHFAAAVEYVHTYSLIHDDLPCMDNDDYRRGKLSSHKKFGEANALLAGDALLTHAFSLAAAAFGAGEVPAGAAVRACAELSRLAGADGMVGGQYIDLASEGAQADAALLFAMDRLKTGALIEAAAVLGCIAAGADEEKITAARTFAVNLGLAFQITDDLLEQADEGNSDDANNKVTYVSCFGTKKAAALAADYTEKAIRALDVFGPAAEDLRAFAGALLNRKN
ncbi:MAG: polyprenyl synthetase family protein [Clostridia bacterium]|nr:polyprenyl synthetase family protein [Clostridia bacterium]